MKVTFRNNFIVPGFGRRRFPKGYVNDVPDALRHVLPKSATIHPDDFEPVDDTAGHEDAAARKYAEEQAKAAATARAMNQAGMDGWADESDPDIGPQPKRTLSDPLPMGEAVAPGEQSPDLNHLNGEPEWEFDGRVYKTESAMKAAITRKENKG